MTDLRKAELLKKYNVPGPRYTSYPTVPYWEVTPTEQQWISALHQELQRGKESGAGASVYVHLPFCESLCTYCGCNTRITRNHQVEGPYVDALLREWDLYSERLGWSDASPLDLAELHLGGGTPTFLSVDSLSRLIDGLLEKVRPTADVEFSLEADPRVTQREQLIALHSRGFRRLSLGIQDFDPRVQEIVHRVQTEEQVGSLVEQAREIGYTSVNFDLIYGLPLQTLKSIEETMAAVRRLRPDRIAFYAYAHVPWIKPGQRRFSEADLPSGEEKRALYELGRSLLEQEGYREVGMDHFALETDGLFQSHVRGTLHRNFMGYTPRFVTPQFGLGVSSIGDAFSVFAQNEKIVEKYQERVMKGELPIFRGHCLTQEDQILRRHILSIMTSLKTSWNDPSQRLPFLDDVSMRLAEFVRDGLVRLASEDRAVEITEEGVPFLRNICMAFDARLMRKAPETNLFSRTI